MSNCKVLTRSSNKSFYNPKGDTLCFSIDLFKNDIMEIFCKIISQIEIYFGVALEKNVKATDVKDGILHLHYKIEDVLLEIKLIKKEILYSIGKIKLNLKGFSYNDKQFNTSFKELCYFSVKPLL